MAADTISLGGHPAIYYRLAGTKLEMALEDLNSATVTTVPHGLPGTPDGCDSWLECVVADMGYEPGDRVPFKGDPLDASGNGNGFGVSADTENVYLVYNSASPLRLRRVNSSTPNTNIGANDWKLCTIPYMNVSVREEA